MIVGHLDLYVRYFQDFINAEYVNLTIEMPLRSEKKEPIVKYGLLNKKTQQVFASRYKLHLPAEEKLAYAVKIIYGTLKETIISGRSYQRKSSGTDDA